MLVFDMPRSLTQEVIVTLPDGRRGRVKLLRQNLPNGKSKVKLCFDFPRDVTINRLEVQDRIDGGEPQPRPSTETLRGA